VATFPSLKLADLVVDDEASFSHVGLYADLHRVVAESDHRFLVLHGNVRRATWDRAAFLNLTFWHALEPVDVLVDEHIAADVVGHVAWHLLAARNIAPEGSGGMAPATLLLSEAIASAFDLYLVGRLLGHRPDSEFLETQVPAMAEQAVGAGMDEEAFEAMLQTIADDPERAFEDLRALLFDAATALYACEDAASAARVLEGMEDRRFSEILHHYELSNWVLYCRAYGAPGEPDRAARDLDRTLREAPVALDWLEKNWVRPALDRSTVTHPSRRAKPR
jgi:hypothetical protein